MSISQEIIIEQIVLSTAIAIAGVLFLIVLSKAYFKDTALTKIIYVVFISSVYIMTAAGFVEDFHYANDPNYDLILMVAVVIGLLLIGFIDVSKTGSITALERYH